MAKVLFEGEEIDAVIQPGPVGYYWGKLSSKWAAENIELYDDWRIFFWDGEEWSSADGTSLNPNLVQMFSHIPTPDGKTVSPL